MRHNPRLRRISRPLAASIPRTPSAQRPLRRFQLVEAVVAGFQHRVAEENPPPGRAARRSAWWRDRRARPPRRSPLMVAHALRSPAKLVDCVSSSRALARSDIMTSPAQGCADPALLRGRDQDIDAGSRPCRTQAQPEAMQSSTISAPTSCAASASAAIIGVGQDHARRGFHMRREDDAGGGSRGSWP